MPETASSRQGSRLNVDDWLQAAMEVLTSEGVGAIKISRLCKRLGVTKGSFYWHFDDVAALMAAVADHCRQVEQSAGETLDMLEHKPPVERIHGMVELVTDKRRLVVESAVRTWALTDESMADTVSALDAKVFTIAEQAMRDLGFDELHAHARAAALLYAGVGYVQSFSRNGPANDEDMRIFIDLLTRP